MADETKLTRPVITFVYRNFRGEIEERTVVDPMFVWAKSKYHGDQDMWLVVAYDMQREGYRDFKLDDILTPMRTYVQKTAAEQVGIDLSTMMENKS